MLNPVQKTEQSVSKSKRLNSRKIPLQPLNKKSGGSPNRSGLLGGQKYHLPLPEWNQDSLTSSPQPSHDSDDVIPSPQIKFSRHPRLYISNTNFRLSCSNEDTVRRMIETQSQSNLYDYGGTSYSSATANAKELRTVSIDKRCQMIHKDVRREI